MVYNLANNGFRFLLSIPLLLAGSFSRFKLVKEKLIQNTQNVYRRQGRASAEGKTSRTI